VKGRTSSILFHSLSQGRITELTVHSVHEIEFNSKDASVPSKAA
jgi:hypothetical protein